MKRSDSIDRRSFLKAAAAGGLAGPRLVHALVSTDGAPGASDKLTVGCIGIGGRGEVLLNEALATKGIRVAAVCDVDRSHLDKAAARAKGAAAYGDFRRLLDRKDIDAVIVATPDHWHALIAVAACRAGKHVYCEKPLSHNVVEGRRMVEAARKHKRVVQVGTHHRGDAEIREVCELIRSGRIGKVERVELWMWANPFEAPSPGGEPPPELDYDLWLGPAPKVPYHEKRCHFSFRWFRDYAGGYMTDWGAHMINVITWAMDADLAQPVAVEGRESPFEKKNLFDFPATQKVKWTFERPAFSRTWTEPGADAEPDRHGMRFIGSEGTLLTVFGKIKDTQDAYQIIRGGKVDRSEPKPGDKSGDVSLPRIKSNLLNWADAIRGEGELVNDVAVGHTNALLCHLGNIASQLARPLKWDGEKERFVGDEAANRKLSREYRAPRRLT